MGYDIREKQKRVTVRNLLSAHYYLGMRRNKEKIIVFLDDQNSEGVVGST